MPRPRRTPRRGWAVHPVRASLAVLAVLVATATLGGPATGGGSVAAAGQPRTARTSATAPPPVRHVFVINLENKGYDETFGPASPAPYLSPGR